MTRHVSELVANDGVVNQALAKGLSLHRVLESLLQADPRQTGRLRKMPPPTVTLNFEISNKNESNGMLVAPLKVEIIHNVLEAVVLLSNEVFNGNLHVFHRNVSSAWNYE